MAEENMIQLVSVLQTSRKN